MKYHDVPGKMYYSLAEPVAVGTGDSRVWLGDTLSVVDVGQ
jgi:hypothetical protein